MASLRTFNSVGGFSVGEVPTIIILPNGDKYWFLNSNYHREDGPAVEYADGTKEWWMYGKRHRDTDLPAIVEINGCKKWYKEGKLQR